MPSPIVIVNPVAGTCDPDTVEITQDHGRGVAITFKIDPAVGNSWAWSPNAIVVDGGGDIFTGGGHPGGNGKGNVQVFDRNLSSDTGTFKYTANLIKDGTTPVAIDPSIQNKPS